MSKRIWVVELVQQIVKCDVPTAEMLVDRLMEEGLLVLGYGDADIDAVVMQFTETFGTTKVSQYDRFAARRLVTRYGRQAVCGIIQLLGQGSTEKYVPVVNSVVDLEKKWVSVLHFLRKTKGDEEIAI